MKYPIGDSNYIYNAIQPDHIRIRNYRTLDCISSRTEPLAILMERMPQGDAPYHLIILDGKSEFVFTDYSSARFFFERLRKKKELIDQKRMQESQGGVKSLQGKVQ